MVKIPILLFVESIERALVANDNPLTPPDKVTLVSLVNVQVSALEVTVSPAASPRIVFPVFDIFPLIVRAVPTIALASIPLDTRREPAKELDPVLNALNVPDILTGPANEPVPLTSRSPDMSKSFPDLM